MIKSYDELYLNDAIKSLSNLFDYVINDCKIECDFFADIFANSKYIKLFENGNPNVISGLSGEELSLKILNDVFPNEYFPKKVYKINKSPEYWSGWALSQYQYHSCRSFKEIFFRIKLSKIIEMYNPYHEMDVKHFIDAIDNLFDENICETNLKRIRESRKLSQSELAKLSGVSLRSIQLYEQRVNDIDKAQSHTLYKLSKALCCEIENLLENPQITK